MRLEKSERSDHRRVDLVSRAFWQRRAERCLHNCGSRQLPWFLYATPQRTTWSGSLHPHCCFALLNLTPFESKLGKPVR